MWPIAAWNVFSPLFPADRILMTGNPIRDNMHPCTDEERRAGQEMFSLDPSLPTVLIVGGSGGCGTFNSVMSTACRKNGGKFPCFIRLETVRYPGGHF